jgi:hypothetical protein
MSLHPCQGQNATHDAVGRMPRREEQLVRVAGRFLTGAYVLYDGSMPVYVGRDLLLTQLRRHRASNRRRRFWDYFSSYEIPDEPLRKDTEALLIRTLPLLPAPPQQTNRRFRRPRPGSGKRCKERCRPAARDATHRERGHLSPAIRPGGRHRNSKSSRSCLGTGGSARG